ncbi:MAG: cyclic nucleotide-binding domain-containing protein [Deltaproteobacteria bacterium]|nr:cyclic nucleotide-binding domain-containing protein [Deltaproteobacteria bacterium]
MSDMGYLKDNQEILQRLRSLPTLKHFEEKDIQGILSLSRMTKYQPGEVIIEEGQYDNWIYFIIAGEVSIRKRGETLGVLRDRGDIFGEMGIIDGSPRSATIIAIRETVCLGIDASYMDRLAGHDRVAFHCVLYQVFSQILANRLRLADERLLRAMDENAVLKAELQKLRAGGKGL